MTNELPDWRPPRPGEPDELRLYTEARIAELRRLSREERERRERRRRLLRRLIPLRRS